MNQHVFKEGSLYQDVHLVLSWSNNSNPEGWYGAKVTRVTNESSCRNKYSVLFHSTVKNEGVSADEILPNER